MLLKIQSFLLPKHNFWHIYVFCVISCSFSPSSFLEIFYKTSSRIPLVSVHKNIFLFQTSYCCLGNLLWRAVLYCFVWDYQVLSGPFWIPRWLQQIWQPSAAFNNSGLNYAGPLKLRYFSIVNIIVLQGLLSVEPTVVEESVTEGHL